eukprot:6044293-Pyramimonas_sp.AAC.1
MMATGGRICRTHHSTARCWPSSLRPQPVAKSSPRLPSANLSDVDAAVERGEVGEEAANRIEVGALRRRIRRRSRAGADDPWRHRAGKPEA